MSERETPFKKALENANYTRERLASEIGVTAVRVYQWEQDKRRPNMKLAKQIMALLNCNYTDLYKSEEQ